MDQRALGSPHSGYFRHSPRVSPRGRSFPFFFLSPFIRGEGQAAPNFAQHHCQEGDSLQALARTYNVPLPILEAVNSHLPDVQVAPGSVVHIPRMDTMFCQKVYLDQRMPGNAGYFPHFSPSIPSTKPSNPAAHAPSQPFPRYNHPTASYKGFYSC